MTARIPLVINSGAIQELQSGDSFNLGTGASLTSPTIATSMTLSYGTANQVQYLNGSKQLVGDADLTFDGTTLSVAAINVTTVDLTNLEVTNIKAKDGTAAITLADSTGVATLSANPILNAGTANGVAYLNGSKVLTTGSALTLDGNTLVATNNANSNSFYLKRTSAVAREWALGIDGDGGFLLKDATGSIGTLSSLPGGITYLASQTELVFKYNSTNEGMRLTSTGLGIGTSSPSAKLAVGGGTGAQGAAINGGATNSGDGAQLYIQNGGVTYGGIGNYSAVFGGAYDPSIAVHGYSGLRFFTVGTEKMRLDTSGNLGLGVTPSAWSGFAGKTMQFGYGSIFNDGPATIGFSANAYYNGGWKYYGTGAAAVSQTAGGAYYWFTAPSGTAGNAISFTQAMTLDASGNLGIGTSNPAAKLDVRGAGYFIAATNPTTFLSVDSGLSTGSMYNQFNTSSNVGLSGTYTNHPYAFVTNNIERMRIDSSGNVGIGTSSSLDKLTVAGAIKSTGYINTGAITANSTFVDNYSGSARLLSYGPNSSTNGTFTFYQGKSDNSSGQTAMYIDSSGNVGIGTSSPATKLNVYTAASGDSFRIATGAASGSGFGYMSFADAGGRKAYIGSAAGTNDLYINTDAASSNLILQTVSTERMRIDSSGNLLVGTGGLPQANGTLSVASSSTTARFYSTGGLSAHSAIFDKSGNDNSASQYYVGFTYNAQSNGAGRIVGATSTVAFAAWSDRRLKENIHPLENQLSKLIKLKPSEFDYKDGRGHCVGFIAQDVQEVFPEMVAADDDEMGTLYIAGLSAFEARLVAAIKELKSELDATKAEVAALKGA